MQPSLLAQFAAAIRCAVVTSKTHRAMIYLVCTLRKFLLVSYMWQVLQLVPEQELQDELPPIGPDGPSLSLEKQAQEENTRLARL